METRRRVPAGNLVIGVVSSIERLLVVARQA
jgi:hypothetical protein